MQEGQDRAVRQEIIADWRRRRSRYVLQQHCKLAREAGKTVLEQVYETHGIRQSRV